MEGKDFDKTLDLTKIKPYGDTMNDGKTQLSFTLPVPCGDEAVEAAKQLIRKMGLENPQVVFYKQLTEGFTFFQLLRLLYPHGRLYTDTCAQSREYRNGYARMR